MLWCKIITIISALFSSPPPPSLPPSLSLSRSYYTHILVLLSHTLLFLFYDVENFNDPGNKAINSPTEISRRLNLCTNTHTHTHTHMRVRYFVRVVITRRLSDIVKELDVAVHTLSHFPEMNNSLKMEVGIEDCLHIEFEYNKAK